MLHFYFLFVIVIIYSMYLYLEYEIKDDIYHWIQTPIVKINANILTHNNDLSNAIPKWFSSIKRRVICQIFSAVTAFVKNRYLQPSLFVVTYNQSIFIFWTAVWDVVKEQYILLGTYVTFGVYIYIVCRAYWSLFCFGCCLQRVTYVVIATRAGWAGDVCAAI